MIRTRAFALLAAAAVVTAAPAAVHAEEDTRAVTRVVLLTDHSQPVRTWSPMTVTVRVEDANGVPMPGRLVSFWDDSYMRWRCCGPPYKHTTDANGIATDVLHLDGSSVNPVRVAALVHGTETHQQTKVEWYQQMTGWRTTLNATYETVVTGGDAIPVAFRVRRDDTGADNGCIEGAVVQATLSGPETHDVEATIPDDGTCTAPAELPSTLAPGDYLFTATTGHSGWSRTDEPETLTYGLRVNWQHTYTDAHGRGTVYVNYASRHYRVVLADGRDSGVRHAGSGMTRLGVTGTVSAWRIELSHATGADTANGSFYSTYGTFSASGTLAGAPWSLSR